MLRGIEEGCRMIESETIQLERLDTGTSYWERPSVAAAKRGVPLFICRKQSQEVL